MCRCWNAPPARVKMMWRMVGGAASLGYFLANPIFESKEDVDVRASAEAVIRPAEGVFDVLHLHCPCAPHVRRQMHDRLMREVAVVWTPGKPWHMAYVGDVVRTVIFDVTASDATRGIGDAVKGKLQELYMAVERLCARFFDDTPYADDTLDAIVRLSDTIIGDEVEERRPSLYIVNGRLLFVARGRAEVRRIALREYGLSRPRIRGVASGERFADGRTAEDVIRLAKTVPSHIGRLED